MAFPFFCLVPFAFHFCGLSDQPSLKQWVRAIGSLSAILEGDVKSCSLPCDLINRV